MPTSPPTNRPWPASDSLHYLGPAPLTRGHLWVRTNIGSQYARVYISFGRTDNTAACVHMLYRQGQESGLTSSKGSRYRRAIPEADLMRDLRVGMKRSVAKGLHAL